MVCYSKLVGDTLYFAGSYAVPHLEHFGTDFTDLQLNIMVQSEEQSSAQFIAASGSTGCHKQKLDQPGAIYSATFHTRGGGGGRNSSHRNSKAMSNVHHGAATH